MNGFSDRFLPACVCSVCARMRVRACMHPYVCGAGSINSQPADGIETGSTLQVLTRMPCRLGRPRCSYLFPHRAGLELTYPLRLAAFSLLPSTLYLGHRCLTPHDVVFPYCHRE